MKLTAFRRRQLTEQMAGSQDGKLKGNDPINDIIINALNQDNTEEVEQDLAYAISELSKAHEIVRQINV